MLPSYTAAFAQMRGPSYFPWIAFGLLSLGALGWLIAAALGFARARAFGESPRWFAISAVCLLLYHIQIFVFVIYGISEQNPESLLAMGAFFNLFVALGAVCAIIGFMRMNDPRTGDIGGDALD
ncbi:MAG TPA: hypothetical protein VF570_12480 [Pyrinomonadaceae bacterium]|jgi:uncharacterized membrane protein YhdT